MILDYDDWYEEIGSDQLDTHIDSLTELQRDEWDDDMVTGIDTTTWLNDAYNDYVSVGQCQAYEEYKDAQI